MAKKKQKPPPTIVSVFRLFGSMLLLGGIAIAATDLVFDNVFFRIGALLLAVSGALFHFGLASLIVLVRDIHDVSRIFARRQENYQNVVISLMKVIEARVTVEPLILPTPSHSPPASRGEKTSLDHYYHDGISQHGPFPKQDMQDLIDSGEIGPETQVYVEGWVKWLPLKEVPTGSFSR